MVDIYSIDPEVDHNEVFNVDKAALEKANKALGAISSLASNANNADEDITAHDGALGDETPVEVATGEVADIREMVAAISLNKKDNEDLYRNDDSILHKRTESEYQIVWEQFLKKEEKGFKKMMGYGKKEIEAIGINKFIDFMDWTKTEHVSKWKSDALHVIPCCECEKEFSIFEHYRLCKGCISKFDMELLAKVTAIEEEKAPGSAFSMMILFGHSVHYRNQYKITKVD